LYAILSKITRHSDIKADGLKSQLSRLGSGLVSDVRNRSPSALKGRKAPIKYRECAAGRSRSPPPTSSRPVFCDHRCSISAAQSATQWGLSDRDIELMAQIQVLDLKSASRLEPVQDKRKEQVKNCKHRNGRCADLPHIAKPVRMEFSGGTGTEREATHRRVSIAAPRGAAERRFRICRGSQGVLQGQGARD
jgi:hypothetical protein